MKNVRAFRNFACFTAMLSTAAVFGFADELAVGAAQPDWHATDLQGHAISTSDFKNKVVIVDFWATWCAPCVAEIPGYIELEKKYSAQGLVLVGISMDTTGAEAVQKFAESKKLNYPVVLATDDLVHTFGDPEAIPTTFVFDRSGRLAYKKFGAMKPDAFEAIVKPLVEKKG